MAPMSDSEHSKASEDKPTLEVSDNDYVNQERLKSILERYKDVLDREDQIETRRVQGAISNDDADKHYKTVVNQYVQDALKVIKGNGFAKWVWPNENNEQLGTVTISPPTPYHLAWQQARPAARIGPDPPRNPTRMPRGYSVVNKGHLEDVTYDIHGLMGFTNAPQEFVEQFSVEIRGPDGLDTHTISVTEPMPRHISRQAFQWANSLLNQLNIGIEVSEKQKEAIGEYSIATVGDISEKFNHE